MILALLLENEQIDDVACLTLCFVVYSTRRFVVYSTRRFVFSCLVSFFFFFFFFFFSPFSIAITLLGEERANLSAFRTFVRFVLVWICRFPLPLDVWEGLRFVALPGLFLLPFLSSFYTYLSSLFQALLWRPFQRLYFQFYQLGYNNALMLRFRAISFPIIVAESFSRSIHPSCSFHRTPW